MAVKNSPLIFISYVREDKQRIINLGKSLREYGFDTWIDIENIFPGERWADAIESALKRADFVIVCLSSYSVSKRGFAQREIKRALNTEEEMLDGDIFLIPVKLDACELPSRLQQFQWIDAGSDSEFGKVVNAITEGCRRRQLELDLRQKEGLIRTEDEHSQVDLSELGGAGLLKRIIGRKKIL